jgi:3-phenylpropionate/trans-cinnamate dioxygenase ferredoxin reductase component
MRRHVVVVGGGAAGFHAIESLRSQGFDGPVTLVADESLLPYARPPLSKEVLRGEMAPERVLLRGEDRYAELGVTTRLGASAVAVDRGRRTVELADGSRIEADAVLLATGGRPRALSIPGEHLPNVYQLRTLADAVEIREHIAAACTIVVIGSGFVACEVAASARQAGCEVTIMSMDEAPLARALGPHIAEFLAGLHRAEGVDLRAGVAAERIDRAGADLTVTGTDGSTATGRAVVIGVGIEPRVELAQALGVRTGPGIIVDEFCQTSVPNVCAAGDAATLLVGGRLRRHEHWQNAQRQGAAAARALIGNRQPFSEVPWFWTNQFSVNVQMAGDLDEDWDRVTFRGDPHSGDGTAFYQRDGRLLAAVGVNRAADISAARALLRRGIPVSPEQLRDPDADLLTFARSHQPIASANGSPS